MKRFLTLFFTALLLSAALCVTASASVYEDAAEELAAIGMFRGTASGYELDRAPTRSEAAIMMVRLYGAEEKAKAAYEAGEIKHPFTDVSSFTAPYVAWLYENGISKGVSATAFGSAQPCTAQNYTVFLLRALGYQDGTDFPYAEALEFAASKGLLDTSALTGSFLRDDLAGLTYQALGCQLKDGTTYLLDSLIKSGAINDAAAKPITDKIQLLTNLCAAYQDNLDADVSMDLDISLKMPGLPNNSASLSMTGKGRIQTVLADNPQAAITLEAAPQNDSGIETLPDSSIGIWMKDGWMYVQMGDETVKTEAGALVPSSASSSASTLPLIDTISAKASGRDTIYTVTMNDAFTGLLHRIFSARPEFQEENMQLDIAISDYTCTYTVGNNGQLKASTASMKLSVKAIDAIYSIAMDMDLSMEMTVNASGSSVKITFPDNLDTFPAA